VGSRIQNGAKAQGLIESAKNGVKADFGLMGLTWPQLAARVLERSSKISHCREGRPRTTGTGFARAYPANLYPLPVRVLPTCGNPSSRPPHRNFDVFVVVNLYGSPVLFMIWYIYNLLYLLFFLGGRKDNGKVVIYSNLFIVPSVGTCAVRWVA